MGQRHQVNGNMSGLFIASRFLGPLVVAGGAVLIGAGEQAGWAMVIAGAVIALCAEVGAFMVRRKRVWMEVLPDGFIVTDRSGTRELRDHEIVSIAYNYKTNYSNGVPAGYTRTAKLWPGKSAVIELQNYYGEGKIDPLAELLQRLIALLKAGFAQALSHGIEVGGDGWQLNKQQLRCKIRGREEAIPLSEITAVQSFEGKMSVWTRGNEAPVVQLADTGRNVWLLPELLEPYLQKSETDAPPPGSLGRILFSRSPKRFWVVVCVFFAVIAVLSGIGLVIAGLQEPPEMLVVGGIVLLLGPILGLTAAHLAVATFRCQEWGVFQSGLWSKRQLLYKQVASFSYGVTRHYHNGVYTGTNVNMRFVPHPGEGSAISYSATVQGGDDDLENLRGFVSQVIAAQMHERLAAGETVPWTANLTFTPQGLQYRPAGFISRKDPVLLPFEKYHGYNMDQGVFYLFEKNVPKAVMNENVAEANFFPGFHLLLLVLHAEQPAPAEESN